MSMLSSIPMETLIVWGAALQAFLIVLFVWNALLVRDVKAKRMRAIQQQQKELQNKSLAAVKHGLKRPKVMGFVNKVVKKLNVLRTREAEKVIDDLAQAGYRSKEALNIYFFFRFSLPFAFGALAMVWLYVLGMGDLQPMGRMLVAIVAVLIGAYAPKIFVINQAQKRGDALQKALPDALDLMVVCAEAGLSLDMALKRVSKEMMGPNPEMAEELSLTAMELGFLPNRADALANLNKRTNMEGLRAVVGTLQQTERYGTPLAQSLRVLSQEFRTERMLRAEEKAAKLPATLTVPMILFIMPALFIVLLGPAIIRAVAVFPNF
ncbi:Type II secretion system protein [Candidatus Terasakiella magnetica]|uniref:Type II secretion system protein n=1 Tax=Candidatus Terasakiella magnetica TaxID=1867952 RepID=A0A1C3REN9_9PROT|nr:type II secretion system F family protein [Candidatus Terasakiella magnetica]SCA55711.1 Type II secretion system protein [Candidatus Terasakiella magnetica]